MPYSSDFFPSTPISQSYPGTDKVVTHSFDSRLMIAEFDDALVDQAPWKNPRYDGSKITGKSINKFTPLETVGIGDAQITVDFIVGQYPKENWPGDNTYLDSPVINNESTALYIANTVIGGEEDPQFATIRNHSYVGINKMLLINPIDDSVKILDRAIEPYEEFHRFITNDFPTGNKCRVKIIDESIGTNLKGEYRVKMNKGYLLKTFEFEEAGEFLGSTTHPNCLLENNSMYLYKKGNFRDNFIVTGSANVSVANIPQSDQLRFRYGLVEMFSSATQSAQYGHPFNQDRIGPLFNSSSIIENKYTQQYYTGSYGFIQHQTDGVHVETFSRMFAATGLGSASKFLGLDTLNFLSQNNTDFFLTEQEKTEVHITFFKGMKDFAPFHFDERSIGTFEVDGNKAQLGIEQGDTCNAGLPTNHELVFKGPGDNRFMPTLHVSNDNIDNAHLQELSNGLCAPTGSLQGTVNGDGFTTLTTYAATLTGSIQPGITVDQVTNMKFYVQGGALGVVGYQGSFSSSIFSSVTTSGSAQGGVANPNYGKPLNITGGGFSEDEIMTEANYYTGSFNYEVSFLDKDHTLILDINKTSELFDGIGEKGLVIIPENSLSKIKNNIEYYLEKAGIIENTTNTQQNLG